VLLYNLAADYAAKCDTPSTLKFLQRVALAKGGLDPAEYRGFAYLRDMREFKAIVAEIHRTNKPRIQSKPAFVIDEPNLFPEGMAYARYNGRVYLGSVQRKIVWTDKTGEVHDLVTAGEDGLAYVAGLHLDETRKELWAVSSRFGDTSEFSDAVQGLFEYDLSTGKRIATFVAPGKSSGYLNDVALVPSTGKAYVTNTLEGSVYCPKTGSRELELFLPPGTVAGANGIAVSDDERTLFVAGDVEIYRVDLGSKSSAPLEKTPGVVDASIDGLYFYHESLVGIQNGIHPGRVVRFYLDPTLTRITSWEILETYNPVFENPTTGSLDGNSLLFMANTQLHKWQMGKPLPPAKELRDIQILRIPLAQY
jgi:sugar lactone lactonase YvrE